MRENIGWSFAPSVSLRARRRGDASAAATSIRHQAGESHGVFSRASVSSFASAV